MNHQTMSEMLTLCGKSSKQKPEVKTNSKNFVLSENGMGFKLNALRLGDTILVISKKIENED